MLTGRRRTAWANIGAMELAHAPDRCNARVKRIAQVKFVVLPLELLAEPAAARRPLGRLRALLRSSLLRVIGCLEAARP